MAGEPGVRGVLERAIRTSRRHWRALFVIALAIFVPIGLIDVLDHHLQESELEHPSGAKAFEVGLVAVSHTVTSLLGEILFAGVVAAAVSETHGGKAPSLSHIVRTLPYWTLIAIDILFSIGLVFTLLLLIVPGVFFFGRYALAAPVAKIERRGIRESFARSRALTHHHVGLVLLVLLPIVFGGQIVSQLAVTEIGDLTGGSFFGEWLGATIAEMLAGPLWALAAVSLTFELIEHGRREEDAGAPTSASA